jgi:hypothetical protein
VELIINYCRLQTETQTLQLDASVSYNYRLSLMPIKLTSNAVVSGVTLVVMIAILSQYDMSTGCGTGVWGRI